MSGARVVGVDFSGGASAGRTTWIAQARDDGRRLVIERLCPARDLPGGAVDRASAHRALVSWLLAAEPVIAGFDFPFGLPRDLVAEPDWRSWLHAFVDRHESAESFRAWCRERSRGREWKRRTDREEKTPMCVYNLRLHRQTWHGLCDVVAPLLREGAAAMPMQAGDSGDAPLLLETCPASLLKRHGLPVVYKGRTPTHRRARLEIARWLDRDRDVAWATQRLRRVAVDDVGGDALDATLAASSAAAARRGGVEAFRIDALDEHYAIEARVYCG